MVIRSNVGLNDAVKLADLENQKHYNSVLRTTGV